MVRLPANAAIVLRIRHLPHPLPCPCPSGVHPRAPAPGKEADVPRLSMLMASSFVDRGVDNLRRVRIDRHCHCGKAVSLYDFVWRRAVACGSGLQDPSRCCGDLCDCFVRPPRLGAPVKADRRPDSSNSLCSVSLNLWIVPCNILFSAFEHRIAFSGAKRDSSVKLLPRRAPPAPVMW